MITPVILMVKKILTAKRTANLFSFPQPIHIIPPTRPPSSTRGILKPLLSPDSSKINLVDANSLHAVTANPIKIMTDRPKRRIHITLTVVDMNGKYSVGHSLQRGVRCGCGLGKQAYLCVCVWECMHTYTLTCTDHTHTCIYAYTNMHKYKHTNKHIYTHI